LNTANQKINTLEAEMASLKKKLADMDSRDATLAKKLATIEEEKN